MIPCAKYAFKYVLEDELSLYSRMAKFLLIGFDKLEGRNVYECREHLKRTQWLKKEELERLQLSKLRALLKHAYDNVPHYHEAFDKAHFKPERIKCLDDLSKVPVLNRSTLCKDPESLVARDFPRKALVCRHTSGTTAAPVSFYRSKRDVSWGIAAELRGYSWAGYEVGHKLAMIWQVDPRLGKTIVFKFRNLLNRNRYFDVNAMSERSMMAFAKEVRRLKPDFIRGYPGSTSIFATFVSRNLDLGYNLKGVFTSGETLLPHYRKRIEEAFGCKVFDYYATSEVSHVAAQCGHHEGLHIFQENVLLELVSDDDEPVSGGKEGRILMTNLHSSAVPFIRYDVGDTGKMYSDECSCGRELPLFRPIGRTYERFLTGDGSFTVLRDFQTVFEEMPIQDFQVVQESINEIVVRIVAEPGYSQSHTDFILKNLRMRGKANIRVELTDSMLPGKSGKIGHVVSKIPNVYT